ncbi:MAG: hypothetical protein HY907_01425 [Deltaproteobacteria bacterium]|nr:hypothetical protein [Deltaproteobacteria bacterium]
MRNRGGPTGPSTRPGAGRPGAGPAIAARGPRDGSIAGAALLVVLAVTAAVAGCRARKDRCGDPVTVAQSFVEAMNGSDPGAALRYLSREALADLDRRSKAAAAALGQKLSATDILVPERSVLPRPEWLVLRTAAGDEAWVDVRPPADGGPPAERPWSTQRLVREDGCWKVDLFHASGPAPAEATARDEPGSAPAEAPRDAAAGE